MVEMVLVSAVYPQPEARCRQFADSVARACEHAAGGLVLLVAEADYVPDIARQTISHVAELRVVSTALRRNPPALRAHALSEARATGCDAVALLDYDDIADPEILVKYADAFSDRQTDIAYGDLSLLDAEGLPLGRLMFDADLPERLVDQAALHDGNVLGFSNTALRPDLLDDDDLHPPPAIVAYDWWLYTRLLGRSAKGRNVGGLVAGYRLHDANTLGDEANPTSIDIERRMKALAAHYAAFDGADWAASRLSVVEAAIAVLQTGRPIPEQAMQSFRGKGGPWFARLLAGARRMAGEA